MWLDKPNTRHEIYVISVGQPERRRPLTKSNCRLKRKGDIKMDLNKIRICGLGSCGLGQKPVKGSCEYDTLPPLLQDVGNLVTR
jgi:hypothetical protein